MMNKIKREVCKDCFLFVVILFVIPNCFQGLVNNQQEIFHLDAVKQNPGEPFLKVLNDEGLMVFEPVFCDNGDLAE